MITQQWESLLRETQSLARDSIAHYEQSIRDAHASKEINVNGIARALDVDRAAVLRVLNAGGEVPIAKGPNLPTTIYLRARSGLFDRAAHALASRGYFVTGSEDQAWHLSRSGVAIVRVILISQLDDGPIWIEAVRAVFEQKLEQPVPHRLADYLPTMESIRLEREHPDLANWTVYSYTDSDVKWKTIRGGQYERRRVFDPEAINNMGRPGGYATDVQYVARTVAELLGDQTDL